MNGQNASPKLLAEAVYRDFLREVVEVGVLNDREGVLTDKQQKAVDKGTHINVRVVRLMSISGKGGWSPDSELTARYASSRNVTLLDHLLSVTRGAMVLTALDKLRGGIEPDRLKAQLAVVAVVAFSHDLDKDLSLPRHTLLPVDAVAERMKRYGLDQFLERRGLTLEPDQLLYLIELVEDSQAHRSVPKSLPEREYQGLTRYIKLADKLDGAWLAAGLKGVKKRLAEDRTLDLGEWESVEIYDPHHPFILDELQTLLSTTCTRICGMPPLIEAHEDGCLYMLLPGERHVEIVERSLNQLPQSLPFRLELTISNRGTPRLQNARPDYATLTQFIQETVSERDITRLFSIKALLRDIVADHLEHCLEPLNLSPRWPEKTTGATLSPYASLAALSPQALVRLRKAALLGLFLNLGLPTDKKSGYPDYANRERALLTRVEVHQPDWLTAIKDDSSRHNLTALWLLSEADADPNLEDAIWGEGGLLQRWWQGDGKWPAFRDSLPTEGECINPAVVQRYRQLLLHEQVTASDETDAGRCLFTDEPVPFDSPIRDSLGLYEVNVSAFSGRDNRPENLRLASGFTNISPTSVAEHRLRAEIFGSPTSKKGVPSLISSPTTSALFGGLALSSDTETLSLFDLSRQEVKKGHVVTGLPMFRGRQRMARFERWPEKLRDQIEILDLMLRASRRIGRPLHVFRGLPTPCKEFFYCDALPSILANLLGSRGLRLEQILDALNKLEIARVLLDENSLGYEVLQCYSHRDSRFSAVCLAVQQFEKRLRAGAGTDGYRINQVRKLFINEYFDIKEKHEMSESEAPLVRLGEMAAKIQRRPKPDAAINEAMLMFKLTMDALRILLKKRQTDDASLVCGIVGELDINLERKDKTFLSFASRRREACTEFANYFVQHIWHGVLIDKWPSQSELRLLGSIYRIAFLNAPRHSTAPEENKHE